MGYVVDPRYAIDLDRPDPIPTPPGGTWYVLPGETPRRLLETTLQVRPVVKRFTLGGRPGAQLAPARSRAEVRVRLFVAHALRGSFEADLRLERSPPEDERHVAAGQRLARLARSEIRIKDEPVLVGALEQHDARGRAARCVHGRQRHRGGLDDLRRSLRALEQRDEALDGIVLRGPAEIHGGGCVPHVLCTPPWIGCSRDWSDVWGGMRRRT